MSGTAFGRYDPLDPCGPSGAARPGHPDRPGPPGRSGLPVTSSGPLHPNSPITSNTLNTLITPNTPSRPAAPGRAGDMSNAIHPMNQSGARGNGLGPLPADHETAPHGRHHDAAGARGAPGETARGTYAAREAQGHPGGRSGEGRRSGEPCEQGAKTGQNSGDGADIGVGAAGAGDTERVPGGTERAPGGGEQRPGSGAQVPDGARQTAGARDDASGGASARTAAASAGAEDPADGHSDGRDGHGDGPDNHAYGSEAHAIAAFGGGGAGDGHGRSHPTGGFGDEDDLRRLLQSRVGALEPSPDALDQLRRAVPARRQRRRHVVLGAAAALLLGGTSIPAMVHVVNLGDSSEERAANAASNQRAQGGTGGMHGEGTEQAGPRPTQKGGETPGEGKPEGPGKAKGKGGVGPGTGDGTPAPDETMDVTSPACGRDQLGQGSSKVDPADSSGRIYGTFRVVNTSGAACSVEGGGAVGLVAQGSTNPDRIHVVDHTSGDEATGLPDPATTPDQLVLKPGEAYEVKFAWIPKSGGGATGCVSPGPSPTPDASKDPGQSPDAGTTAAGDSGGGQAGGDEGAGGGSASGGIVLSHTPEAGEPAVADAKITDACAGTVYRTEALSGS